MTHARTAQTPAPVAKTTTRSDIVMHGGHDPVPGRRARRQKAEAPAERPVRRASSASAAPLDDLVAETAAASGVSIAVTSQVLAAAAAIAAAESGREGTESALLPRLAALRPIPRAAVEAGRRAAELKRALLNAGAWTTEDLAVARGTSADTTRQWVHRQRTAGRLFTVTHDGQALVPAVLLDADLNPRRELTELIGVLADVGETGWAAWAWLVRPSSWLGGEAPERVAAGDTARALAAARARVSNAS